MRSYGRVENRRRRTTLKTFLGLLGSTCAALALAAVAGGGISVGISEDRGLHDPQGFTDTLRDVGLSQNRISLAWDPAAPDAIPNQDQIAALLPVAQANGVRVVISVTARHQRDLLTSEAVTQFSAWLQRVAQTFPLVKDYVIGNEPNQPYFWLPQFDSAGRPVAAAAYEPVLASAYDALKAVDGSISVIGIGLSPRGNDNPNARSNISRSPVRFLRDLGAAYRASHRTRPLMDALAFHPYPARNTDTPQAGYTWPNSGLANLDRIKQAVWDAFNGTPQPTFPEAGGRSPFAGSLRLDLDEAGWQVAIEPALAGLYFGTETQPTIDESTQAQYYAQTLRLAECDPAVDSLNFFLLADEPDLSRWQSGLERIDGSHRPSYDTVRQTIAQTQGNCDSRPLRWAHTPKVVAPRVSFGARRRPLSLRRWSFVASAREEATFRAGIFRAGTPRSRIARSLSRGRPKPVRAAAGLIKAKTRVVAFPYRRLPRGRYLYAIRMQSSMNAARTSLFVSPVFGVGVHPR